jgi:hypothetical protein
VVAPLNRATREPAYSPHAAETELRAWALANERRDDVIRAAAAAGISLQRIQKVTGIARTTIMRILGSPARRAPRRSSKPATAGRTVRPASPRRRGISES